MMLLVKEILFALRLLLLQESQVQVTGQHKSKSTSNAYQGEQMLNKLMLKEQYIVPFNVQYNLLVCEWD